MAFCDSISQGNITSQGRNVMLTFDNGISGALQRSVTFDMSSQDCKKRSLSKLQVLI